MQAINVKRTLEKFTIATLIEDKRTSLTELKALAIVNPTIVATEAFPIIIPALPNSKDDVEMLRGIVETIEACLCSESMQCKDPATVKQATQANTLTLSSDTSHIATLLDTLEERDWAVRLCILKVLSALVVDRLAALQSAVLSSSQGLARLMDVLSDSREIIRNEVLLVMVALTKGNVELQKIMAFEGAFDVLFGIVKEEEEGSIIASDCMHIICNLLKANPSNVTYFREMAGIQEHVVPLLKRSGAPGWDSLFGLTLELIGNMLAANPDEMQQNQSAMGRHGVLTDLAEVCCSAECSRATRILALRMVGVLVHKHTPNRLLLNEMNARCDGQPVLSHVLRACLNERIQHDDKHHEINAAACMVFKCYLAGNVDGQQHLAATLMPQPMFDDDVGGVQVTPIGRVIISSLIGASEAHGASIQGGSLQAKARLTEAWGAASVLSLILDGNDVCKEIAVMTPLELPMSDKPPEQLLKSVLKTLARGAEIDYRAQAAMLRLLCVWTWGCERAAATTIGEPSTVVWLVGCMGKNASSTVPQEAQVHFRGAAALVLACCLQHTSDAELQNNVFNIIDGRIGLDTFTDHIEQLIHSDALMTAKRREISLAPWKPTHEDQAWGYMVCDSDFAVVAELAHASLQKCIFRIMGGGQSPVRGGKGDEAAEKELRALREQVETLKAQAGGGGGGGGGEAERAAMKRCEELEETLGDREVALREAEHSVQKMQEELQGLAQANKMLEEACENKDQEIQDLQGKLAESAGGGDDGHAGVMAELQSQLSTLRQKVKEMEGTEKAAANELRATAKEKEQLKEAVRAAESQGESLRIEREAAAKRAEAAEAESGSLNAQLQEMTKQMAELQKGQGGGGDSGKEQELQKALDELTEKHKALEEEHNDLLIMLAEGNGEEEEEEGAE